MKNVIKKITDICTIVFPAVIAVLVILDLTKVVEVTNVIQQIALVILGAPSALASVFYNVAAKEKAEAESK